MKPRPCFLRKSARLRAPRRQACTSLKEVPQMPQHLPAPPKYASLSTKAAEPHGCPDLLPAERGLRVSARWETLTHPRGAAPVNPRQCLRLPPPTATNNVSKSGACSSNSRPTVPCPSIVSL